MLPQLLELDVQQRQADLLRKMEHSRLLAEAKHGAGLASARHSAWSNIGAALSVAIVSIRTVIGAARAAQGA